MKYRLIELEAVDPDEFAAKHGLEMVVREEPDPASCHTLFCAYFCLPGSDSRLDVVGKEGTEYGRVVGRSVAHLESIRDYLGAIRGKFIRTHREPGERYIQCPDKWRFM